MAVGDVHLERVVAAAAGDALDRLLGLVADLERRFLETVEFKRKKIYTWKPEHLMVTLPSLSMSEANPMAVFRSQSTARGRVWMTSSNV